MQQKRCMAKMQGFSLILSLALLLLLTSLSLAVLTLSRQSTKQAQPQHSQSIVRANARLGLNMALAELQRSAGTDQVVTGRAELLEELSDAENLSFSDSDLPNPFYTLVWDSRGAEINYTDLPTTRVSSEENVDRPGRIPTYPQDQNPRVLVSGNEGLEPTDSNYITLRTAIGSDWIDLAPSQNPADNRGLWVPKTETPGRSGSYAFAVLDEGIKARIGLTDPFNGVTSDFSENSPQRAKVPRRSGERLITEVPLGSEVKDSDFAKLPSVDSVQLLASAIPDELLHDLSARSRGIATNSRDGGLKRDLSLALRSDSQDPSADETGNLRLLFEPAQYNPNNLQGDFRSAGGSERMRPSFSILRRYFQEPYVDQKTQLTLEKGTAYRPSTTFVPVRAQLGIHPMLLERPNDYELLIHFSPAFVLWNPYDEDLVLPEGMIINGNRRDQGMFWWRTLLDIQARINGEGGWSLLFNPERNDRSGFSLRYELAEETVIPPGKALILSGRQQEIQISERAKLSPGWRPGEGPLIPTGLSVPKPPEGVNTPQVQIRMTSGNNKSNTSSDRMDWFFGNDSVAWRQVIANFADQADPPLIDPPVVNSYVLSAPVNATAPSYPALFWGYAFKLGTEEMPTRRRGDQATGHVKWLADFNVRGVESSSLGRGRYGGYLQSNEGFNQSPLIQGAFLPADRAAEFYDIPSADLPDARFGFVGGNLDSGHEQLILFQRTLASELNDDLPNHQNAHLLSISALSDSGVSNGGSNASVWDYRYQRPSNIHSPTWPIGNSRAPHRLPPENVWAHSRGSDGTFTTFHCDHSYLYNEALYDRYFFSSLPQPPASLDSSAPLANSRYQMLSRLNQGQRAELWSPDRSAAALEILGAFNVNSTSTKAWELLIASNYQVPVGDDSSTTGAALPSLIRDGGRAFTGENAFAGGVFARNALDGYRRLSTEEVRELADQIVRQVKLRGPFPSMAAFVNRMRSEEHLLSNRFGGQAPAQVRSEMQNAGALQAAIDRSGVNRAFESSATPVIAEGEYSSILPNPNASVGSVAEGAHGYLSQQTLLKNLDSIMTVRSDTFKIRAYGECLGPNGEVLSTARCEAVVQRRIDYCDPSDAPFEEGGDLSPLNQSLGRRFEIVSFRWLGKDEQ